MRVWVYSIGGSASPCRRKTRATSRTCPKCRYGKPGSRSSRVRLRCGRRGQRTRSMRAASRWKAGRPRKKCCSRCSLKGSGSGAFCLHIGTDSGGALLRHTIQGTHSGGVTRIPEGGPDRVTTQVWWRVFPWLCQSFRSPCSGRPFGWQGALLSDLASILHLRGTSNRESLDEYQR